MTGICAAITSLPCALFWRAISVSEIITGALIGIFAPLHYRAIAATMAVAAGLLLAAATVELAAEASAMTPSLAGSFADLSLFGVLAG